MMVGYIEEYGERFGVEPFCALLPIAPSTYYAHRARTRDSARRGPRASGQDDGAGTKFILSSVRFRCFPT